MIDKVVSLLRLKGEYLTPEIKFFIVALCHYSARKEKGVIVDTEKVLANDLGVSLSTMKQGIRYLEAQDFLLCDKQKLLLLSLNLQMPFLNMPPRLVVMLRLKR